MPREPGAEKRRAAREHVRRTVPRKQPPPEVDEAREAADGEGSVARGIWSGSITFGLVTVPIELYAVVRAARPSLRMLAPDGTPLARIYVSEDGRPLSRDEIARGYEVEPGRFVLVTDEELAQLAPRRSRDIELGRFVDRRSIDPAWFVRPYFALPGGDQIRAYRLLAEVMEASDRAAIASFVLRGSPQVVAIVAERGLLRVHALRFGDEVRDPVQMEIPAPSRAEPGEVRELARAIAALREDALDLAELATETGPDLLAVARRKLERGEDVLRATESPQTPDASESEEDPEGAEVIDLYALIQDRLRKSAAPESDGAAKKREPRRKRPRSPR